MNEISGPGLPDPGAPPSTQDGKYVKPSEAELRQILTPLQFEVTQKNGTEPAFANMYVDNHAEGIYVDVVSGEPLFSSRDKFDSGTGWPSFTRPLIAANLVEKQDMSYGMARVEVRSLYADSHLGHLFDDGPAPTGLRYCMNSAALRFIPVADLEKEGYGRFARLFTDEAVAGAEDGRDASIFPDPPPEPLSAASEARTAVLAGGCFWGMEGVFERLTGVIDVVTGYSGGTADTARYEIVGKGITGHAEAIQVTYDPSRISYGTLLKVFFSLAHNPTELDFQGPDVGAQYRSAIFYADEDQKRTAEAYIEILEAASIFDLPIVTEVTSLEAFYTAEKYHQDFMRRNPDYPYIVCWDAPKVKELLDRYPELVDPSRR